MVSLTLHSPIRHRDYEYLSIDKEKDDARKHYRRKMRHFMLYITFACILIVSWQLLNVFGGLSTYIIAEPFQLKDLFASQVDDELVFSSPSSEWPTEEINLEVLGGDLDRIVLDNNTDFLRPTDGNTLEGQPFNLAILRLPSGLQWGYLGVSRGPAATHSEEVVVNNGGHALQQTLIGFGMNMTSQEKLVPVSKATFLFIRTKVPRGCSGDYSWARVYDGPEDPRLYWSDLNTPMLSFGLPSTINLCRGVALIQDIRSVWPELTAILAHSRQVPSFVAGIAEMEMLEVLKPNQNRVEKNWMGFFPGATSSRNNIFPHFQYSYEPRVTLQPSSPSLIVTNMTPPTVTFQDVAITKGTANSLTCVSRAHPHIETKRFHGATPLYRLTLCKRNTCTPDQHNTVLFSLNHIKFPYNATQMPYGRYFAMHNVTSPFKEVAMGPLFRFADTPDAKVVYALSLTFVPQSLSNDKATLTYGISHGFIDDKLMVGLGLFDREIASIHLSLQDKVIPRMRLCSRI